MPSTGTSAPLVAILCTDIEGSSERRRRFGDKAMDAALAKHNAIVEKSIVQFGGKVFKTTGDGVYATFAHPLEAAHAAIGAQQELAANDWTPVGGLSVRMAINFGSARKTNGDYLGKGVNRAGKLLPLGHGGQILATGETRAVVNAETSSVNFKKVGAHFLDDKSQLVEIFQIDAPGLKAGFPPLRTPRGEISTAPVRAPDGRTYRLRKEFTEADREKFRTSAFREIKDCFRELIDGLSVVPGVSATMEQMGGNAFTCSVINEARKHGVARITVRTSADKISIGDISYVWSAHADPRASNGWFSIEEDDYELHLRGAFGLERREQLSAREAAELLWAQFIERAEISHDRSKAV